MPKVSLIVPIYNQENYLARCITSIRNQAYQNIEIILVNDGSTDNSLAICEEFNGRDSRIKIINQKNLGVSRARNAGIENSTGKYIMFIDGDDWIQDDMVEKLLSHSINNNTDLVISNMNSKSEFRIMEGKFPWEVDRLFVGEQIIHEVLPHMLFQMDKSGKKIATISGSVCTCMYDATFFKKNNWTFNEKIVFGEDREFNIRALSKSKIIFTTNDSYYHYNRSISKGGSTTQRYISNLYSRIQYRHMSYIDVLKECNILSTYQKPLNHIWISSVLDVANNLCFVGSPYSFKDTVHEINELLKESDFRTKVKFFSEQELDILGLKKINLLLNNIPFFIMRTESKIFLKNFLMDIYKLKYNTTS